MQHGEEKEKRVIQDGLYVQNDLIYLNFNLNNNCSIVFLKQVYLSANILHNNLGRFSFFFFF